MRIGFIARSTLYSSPGGDTVQTQQIARHLKALGVGTTIFLTHDKIKYDEYDLFYISNITRPADILLHINNTEKPFILSPIFIDYSEYDRTHRNGVSGFLLKQFSAGKTEYIKTLSRWIIGKDIIRSKSYLWLGQQKSINKILKKTALLLPSSQAEYQQLNNHYKTVSKYVVVPNGIDPQFFSPDEKIQKNNKLILCAARIEGLKNQLNLIKALNNTDYTLILVGSPAPNQLSYYQKCKKIAASNVQFRDHLPQNVLIDYYKMAKVHALPSWFETCGLSSLEAATMGCNITITDKGYAREYFGENAFYCDPSSPESIYNAIEKASRSDFPYCLQEKISQNYTWQKAAAIVFEACKKIVSG